MLFEIFSIIFVLLRIFDHKSNLSDGSHHLNGKKLSFFKIENIYYADLYGIDLLNFEVFSMLVVETGSKILGIYI